jgi:CRISPR-associated protein Cas5d
MKGFCLEVSGPFACFTRPEMKVERVSYDVITPSAARAIFDAILWKPAISWRITKIEVLAPIKWVSVRRNEIGKVASPRTDGLFIEDERQQRAGLFLRDVKYRLHGMFDFIPPAQRAKSTRPVPEWLENAEEKRELRTDETPAKYAAMFERRAKKGQHFHQPYLGCREFAADVRLVDAGQPQSQPISDDRELGWMLFDMDYSTPASPTPLFFRARMEHGIVEIPDRNNAEEVRG